MKRKLLLVDDDDAIRQISGLSLEVVGDWDVVSVASGQAALDAVEADQNFSAVLLDVMMPGLDGPATMRLLRDGLLLGSIPVIFLTAKVQPGERDCLLEGGAAGVIAKPFDPMTLPAQVEEILVAAMGAEVAGVTVPPPPAGPPLAGSTRAQFGSPTAQEPLPGRKSAPSA